MIGEKILEALGLQAQNIMRVQMTFEHNKSEVVVTFADLVATPKTADKIAEVIKRYDLIERRAESAPD